MLTEFLNCLEKEGALTPSVLAPIEDCGPGQHELPECVCVLCVCSCVTALKSEDNLWNIVLFFHHVGPRN